MAKFARIIDIDENTQVLIMVEYNANTERYDLTLLTEIEGLTAKATFEYEHEEKAYDDLNNITLEKAIKFVKRIRDFH